MGAPVYIQIHDEISEAIEAGRWVPGDKIPAERELAEQFWCLTHDFASSGDDAGRRRRFGTSSWIRNLCC